MLCWNVAIKFVTLTISTLTCVISYRGFLCPHKISLLIRSYGRLVSNLSQRQGKTVTNITEDIYMVVLKSREHLIVTVAGKKKEKKKVCCALHDDLLFNKNAGILGAVGKRVTGDGCIPSGNTSLSRREQMLLSSVPSRAERHAFLENWFAACNKTISRSAIHDRG